MKHLEVTCPSCSPDEPVLHDVLTHTRGGSGEEVHVDATVKCGRCGTVHRTEVRVPKPIPVRIVVSSGGESREEEMQLFPDEEIEVGQSLDGIRVTSVETDRGRVESAPASDITTVWTEETAEVDVPFSYHVGDTTFSDKRTMDGDDWVETGDTFRERGIRFRIDSVLTKDGEKPERARAKDVKRVYAESKRAKMR